MTQGGYLKKREDPLEEMRKRQAQEAGRRRELVEQLRARQAEAKAKQDGKNPPGSGGKAKPDIDAVVRAAQGIHLIPFETTLGQPATLNRPTLDLLRRYLQALSTGATICILEWPNGPRDVSFLHPLAMTALLRTPEPHDNGKYRWCDPAFGCRTLYFPWRGASSYANQRYLVRRSDITDSNTLHLTRRLAHPGNGSITDQLHETLGHLNRLRVRETTKPHLAHPSLPELYPVFTAEGGQRQLRYFSGAQNELFARVRFGAALDRMSDYRAALCVPQTAPYGFFGIACDADFKAAVTGRAFSGQGQPPNICLLDLSPTPLSRLGPAWAECVEDFITQVTKRFPELPFLAVTQDPFVHSKLHSILRKNHKPIHALSHIHVRVTGDAITPDTIASRWSQTQPQFSTTAGPTADAIAALSEAARGVSDPALAGTLRREMGSLRKAASLPCGLASAYDILCEKMGQGAAETFLARRSLGALIAPIDQALAAEITGLERVRLEAARTAIDRASKALDAETPIGSLTAEHINAIARKSSRSIVAFASPEDLILGEHRFADDSEAGQLLRRRMDRKVIRLTTMGDLAGILTGIENTKDRNTWKRLILVAPSALQFASVVTRPWLPDQLVTICERTFAGRLSAQYAHFASHPDLAGAGQLGPRLAVIAFTAKREVEARGVRSIDLDLPPTVVQASEDSFIDLIDDEDDGDEAIVFNLASGRRLRVRPGSALIRYNQDAEFNPFERTAARDVQPSQSIVVPNAEFIAEAREILPIRVLAEHWVEVYHTMVEALLPGVSGDTQSAKARTILAGMQRQGARSLSLAAVLDWLRVSDYKQLPPDQRRPHAPQRRREFQAFVAVLQIDQALAEKMWIEGIQQLRIDRRRAGMQMAQAFISVLVDPHGTASHLSKDIRVKIGALRSKALEHLDLITDRQDITIEDRHV